MARGISEQDVFEAADKLLACGERPTIERVRLELGRGSPNTVNRLLDGWWSSLAGRILAKETSKLPAQFQAACERLYEKAITDIGNKAEQVLASKHAEVDTRESELVAREAAIASREAALSSPIEMLRLDLATANQRVVELSTQNGLLTSQFEQIENSARKQGQQLTAAKEALSSAEAKSKVELFRVRSQWDAQENRWLRQIDALRDDLKLMRAERKAEKRSASQRITELQNNVGKLEKMLAAAASAKHSKRKAPRKTSRGASKSGNAAMRKAPDRSKP